MFLHFNDPPFNPVSLASRIRFAILNRSGTLSAPVVIDALHACKLLKTNDKHGGGLLPSQFQELKPHLSPSDSNPDSLVESILNHSSVRSLMHRDLSVLRFLATHPPSLSSHRSVNLLNDYISAHPEPDSRTVSLSWVILRNAINGKHFKDAFAIVDLVNNSSKTNKYNNYFIKYLTLNKNRKISLLIVLVVLVSSFSLPLLSPSLVIIPLAYSFLPLVYLLRWHLFPYPFYRPSLVGSMDSTMIIWSPSITPLQRVQRNLELLMVNRIIVGYNELMDVNVSNFHIHHQRHPPSVRLQSLIKSQLHSRGMTLIPTKDELIYQDYWQSAGYNLEWVEPDQDPVDLK